MTLSLGRLVMGRSPSRLPAGTRNTSMSSNWSRPRPSGRGGRNLGSRYQQLEFSLRSAAGEATLLAEMTETSRLVEQHNSPPVRNGFEVPREDEMFHGLVVPQEPKPPESDGEFPPPLHLGLDNEGVALRMLYVGMCGLHLRSLRGLSLHIPSVPCFTSSAVEIHGSPTVGVASTR
jgi:hypothetical protein